MDFDFDERLPNPHPGEVLELQYLVPLRLSQSALARAIGVPKSRIAEIVGRSRPVTPDTALRLGRFFGTSAKLWLGLQADFDLEEVTAQITDQLQSIDLLAGSQAREPNPRVEKRS